MEFSPEDSFRAVARMEQDVLIIALGSKSDDLDFDEPAKIHAIKALGSGRVPVIVIIFHYGDDCDYGTYRTRVEPFMVKHERCVGRAFNAILRVFGAGTHGVEHDVLPLVKERCGVDTTTLEPHIQEGFKFVVLVWCKDEWVV